MAGIWEHFEHGADIGIRGFGGTLAEAFGNCALAMTAVITDPDTVALTEAVSLECAESDPELLLVDFLNAVIYEMATRRMLFSRFDVSIEHQQLTATAWGEAIDVSRHDPAVEVKGATYTELKVTQEADGSWLAQCVVDV